MIQFYLNGETITCEHRLTIAALLEQHAYDDTTIAVAVNETFTPRQTYADVVIQDNDRIEIVSAMQGG